MTEVRDEPPDQNEAFENLDESLDNEDTLSAELGGGHEVAREIGVELVVDDVELDEVGGKLDDPERMSLLDGGMDDPDGTGPPPRRGEYEAEPGWDRDPVEAAEADATDVDQIPDAARGPDSAR